MQQKIFLLFEASDDELAIPGMPAMLVLTEEHIAEIAKLTNLCKVGSGPRATTILVDLTNKSFSTRPEFIPLEERLSEKFAKPDIIIAIIDPVEMEIQMKVEYYYDNKGISSIAAYYSDIVGVQEAISGKTAIGHKVPEWLANEDPETDFIKRSISEEPFREVLAQSDIEEEDIATV